MYGAASKFTNSSDMGMARQGVIGRGQEQCGDSERWGRHEQKLSRSDARAT